MPIKIYQQTQTSKKFMREFGFDKDTWIFNFTGRDERLPKLKIGLLNSVRYEDQKINHLEKGLYGVKLLFTRENWENLYKKSGEFKLIFELKLYNKDTGRHKDFELFRMPVILKDTKIYKIGQKDIINECICNTTIKVIKMPEQVAMCIRFKF